MRVEDELKTYLQVLWRYKWLISACAVIAMLVALGISFLLKPIYKATATVRVASAYVGSSDWTYASSATRLSNTYVDIATSDVTLNKVMEKLGLPKIPKVQVDVVPETELIDFSATDPDPTLARDIANTLATLMVEQSTQLYGGNAPTALEILKGQLNQAKVDLDNAVNEYDKALRSQPTTAATVTGTPIPNADVETLERLVSIRQQLYGDLLQRYETTQTTEQLRTNAISIVEPASLPIKPDSPKKPLNTVLGFLAGLVTGVILAFLFEGMDGTLRGIEDVQAITKLPILGKIPKLNNGLGMKTSRGLSQNEEFVAAPAFDQLRARLILLDMKPKPATFLITSPEPSAGKSTISANLARSLTHGGNQVVLVDMDFRRPRQHTINDLSNDKGLSDYLRGDFQLDDVLQKTDLPNLRILPAGSGSHIPTEWFTPERVGLLLNTLRSSCDYVLVDAPALLSVADPMVFASQADAVLVVVARGNTERQNLRYALQQLAELKARVVGIVVNKVPNSQLYKYYSERRISRPPLIARLKPRESISVDDPVKSFGLEEE